MSDRRSASKKATGMAAGTGAAETGAGIIATRALLRIALGHAARRPLQSALLVLGVALGVAVVVAIDLANGSALAAFRLSTTTLTGRATHHVVGGPTGLDETLYTRLRAELGVRASAPAVEGLVAVDELGGQPMTLLGVDPFAEPPFRNFLASPAGFDVDELSAFLTQPDTVLLSRDVAARAGVAPGDHLTLAVGTRAVQVTLVGLLAPDDDLSRRALESLVLADVSTAQELLGGTGRLSRIDLLLPQLPDRPLPPQLPDRDAVLARIRAILPPGVQILPASEQQATVESMTDAFQLNLRALSLLALVVGIFLIFNTMRFSVVQRRSTLATLVALGVTRREIYTLILTEAAVLGAVGSALGLGLGIVLARGTVSLITQTINDLYFVVAVRDVPISPGALAIGALLGIATALGAALWPAYEATAVPPVTALRRSDVELSARRAVPYSLAGSLMLVVLAAVLLAAPGPQVLLGLAALATVILAYALTAPAATLALMAVARPVTERLWGPVGRMAPRNVTRALSRTAVAIAALMVAVCVSIGVGVMVDSFRLSVEHWLEDTLQADVFVAQPALVGGAVAAGLDPALVAELTARPEVTRSTTAQGTVVRSPDVGSVDLIAVSGDLAGDRREFVAAIGPAATVWAALGAGAVMISEPLAHQHDLTVGDQLQLITARGPEAFPIAAVVRDYASDNGRITMALPVYRDRWHDDRVVSIALVLAPGVDADRFAAALRDAYAGRERLRIESTRSLRREALRVFDRTFAITTALQILAMIVAFVGVLAALMALQLERAREFATLRATGLTARQLGGLSLLETGLMGTVAGLLSWPAGLTLALMLIHVINRRSFGWSMETHIELGVFLRALAVAVAAALLAGVYSTLRLRQLPVARALREE